MNTASYAYDFCHLEKDVYVQGPHYVTNKQPACFPTIRYSAVSSQENVQQSDFIDHFLSH